MSTNCPRTGRFERRELDDSFTAFEEAPRAVFTSHSPELRRDSNTCSVFKSPSFYDHGGERGCHAPLLNNTAPKTFYSRES